MPARDQQLKEDPLTSTGNKMTASLGLLSAPQSKTGPFRIAKSSRATGKQSVPLDRVMDPTSGEHSPVMLASALHKQILSLSQALTTWKSLWLSKS